MRLALVCSLVIHLAVLMPPGCRPNHDTVLALNGEPLVLNIEPQPEPMRRLIDTLRPADQPPADTDLISDAHSKASDNADEIGRAHV